MTGIIGRMLSLMIARRFIGVLLGIAMFILALEIVTYAREVLEINGGGPSAIALYALARAPAILAAFLPMSMLLALLLTLVELSYRNETAAIWGAGVSPFGLLGMLLPLGLAAGVLHFTLSDVAMPRAAPHLREWGIGDYARKKLSIGEKDPIWMRAGTDILRAGSGDRLATELKDVVIFRRSKAGLLTEKIMAASARLSGERWELSDVAVYYQDSLPPDRLTSLIYSGAMKPAQAGARSGDPEEMSVSDLAYYVENAGFGVRPPWVYQTWWHKRLSLLFAAMVMIALCVPLAMRFRRGGGLGWLFATGIGLGFVFFVSDGIALTMGELGFVAPWLAAWGPLLVFAAIAAAIGFRTETI